MIPQAALYVLLPRRSRPNQTTAETFPRTATSSYVQLCKARPAMTHCNFLFSLQLLCPDKDDVTYFSICAGPELNPTERALVQSSRGLLQLSSCLSQGSRLEEAKQPSAHLHRQPRHRPPNRVRHQEELIALAYFPEEK